MQNIGSNFRFNAWKIGVALAAVLLVWMVLPGSKDKNIDKSASQLLSLAEEIRTAYSKKPDFWGLDTKKAIDTISITEGMLKDGKIINALGGEVLIGKGATGEMLMPGDRDFDVVYSGLSEEQCAKLASYRFSEDEALGIRSLSIINADGERQFFEWGKAIELGSAKKICKSKNSLIWTFGN